MRMRTRIRIGVRLVSCLCSPIFAYSQQPFEVNQPNLVFSVPADKPVAPGTEQSFLLSPGPGLDHVPFEFSFAYVSGGKSPNFIVLTPASGVAPVRVAVSLNPNIVPYMKNGVYNLDITIKSTDPLNPGALGGNIGLLLYGPPAPTITSIVNAASQQPLLSPGEIISIYGTNFGNLPLSSNCPSTVNPAGQAASTTTVTIYDTPAPILYVSPTQINAVVPYNVVLGGPTVPVVVTHNLQSSAEFRAQLGPSQALGGPAVPGIFTIDGSGHGQGAIQNVDPQTGAVTLNGANNPAAKGSAVVIYATGAGLWSQSPADGAIITDVMDPPYYLPRTPVSLTIGGQPAKILYAGAAPNQISGMLQVNAIVPGGIGSGAQPVVLTIGNADNSQQGVTMAVQ